MTAELVELISVLEQLLDAGRALLDASGRKCSALARMKLDLIQETTEQEEALTNRMQALNERRRELTVTLTGEAPPASSSAAAHDGSLGRLIEQLEEPERTKVSVLRTELGEVMKELQFTNITNSIVSRRSLQHFRELLGLLSGAGPGDGRYDRRGTLSRNLGASGLINQIA